MRSDRKHGGRWTGTACGLLVATLLGVGLLTSAGCTEKNELAAPPPPVVFVALPRVESMVLYDEYPGRLEAYQRVELRARVTGILEEAPFQEGEPVEAGQVLFRLERGPLEAAVAEAEAASAIAQAQLQLAQTELDRAERAFEADAASDLEVRRAEAEVAAQMGQVQAAKANLTVARIDLGYAEVTSPIGGRVSEAMVDVGNLVGRDGPTLLTTVVDDDPMYAYFDIDERAVLEYLETVPVNERGGGLEGIRLRLADGSVHDAKGVIEFADIALSTETGTLRIRAAFPNPRRSIVPGFFAQVGVPLPSSSVMLVPAASKLADINGDYVMIVDAEGGVERRSVEVGRQVGTDVVIMSGLTGDERVIVRGLQRARPGSTVEARPLDQAPRPAAGPAAPDVAEPTGQGG